VTDTHSTFSDVPFVFGRDFQQKIIAALLLETTAADLVLQLLEPDYFETPELRWIITQVRDFAAQYHSVPSWLVLNHQARFVDPHFYPTLDYELRFISNLPVRELDFIHHTILEWVRAKAFHRAFQQVRTVWAAGKYGDAIEYMTRELAKINQVAWTKVDRGWYFEELPLREAERTKPKVFGTRVATGVPGLDQILDGGLGAGELGLWQAYPKVGKSTLLMNFGAFAVRGQNRRVLHIILEATRKQLEAKYDTWFAAEKYTAVKHGNMDELRYHRLVTEFAHYGRCLVTRGLTEKWSHTITDIEAELEALKRQNGWKPDLVIVDYADLVRGREGPYHQDWISQRDSIRDLKTLSQRGYAIWTASQPQRPDTKTWDTKESLLKSASIAGGYEKIRAVDFVGSINRTIEEKAAGTARLLAELYRDNEAGQVIHVQTDLARMRMISLSAGPLSGPASSGAVGSAGQFQPTLGYK
jgi:replicative DNA helicase